MKNNNLLVVAMFMSLIGLSNTVRAVPIAVVDGLTNQLLGFDGIELLNDTWNVRFVDRSFVATFGDASGLDFVDSTTAHAASESLASLYNMAEYNNYDIDPTLTNGIGISEGIIVTPYALGFDTMITSLFYNSTNDLNDAVFTQETLLLDNQFDGLPGFVFADWQNVSNVPVPAAIWFMGSGLLGLSGYSHKRSTISKTVV